MNRLAFFAVVACAACASARPPARPAARETEQRGAARENRSIDREIRELVDGRRPLEAFRLRVLWRRGNRMVSSDLRGSGVGFWDSRAQFRLQRSEVESLLRALRDARFGSMPLSYGDDSDDMLRLAGMVTVSIDGVEKTVHQFATGEQSSDLSALAERTLAIAADLAKTGTTVASIDEGLEKLTDRTLDPQAFELALVVRREAQGGSAPTGPDGWLLRLSGRKVHVQIFEREKGYGAAREWALSEDEFRGVMAALRQAEVESLPTSLDAPEYVDFHVRVLDRTKDLIARRLADASRDEGSRDRRRFDELMRALEGVRAGASPREQPPAASH